MADPRLLDTEIPTKNPQPRRAGRRSAPPRGRGGRAAPGTRTVRGDAREGNRGKGRVVVEVVGGITVYPARGAGDRWRATWYENGQRRQCQAVSEERLAVKLEKVSERLAADAYGAERTFFLTNGATQGNHTLCLALAPLGTKIVAQRNSHASVVDGLVLEVVDLLGIGEAEHAADPGLRVRVGDLPVGEKLDLLQLLVDRHLGQQPIDLLLDPTVRRAARGP